MPIDLICLDADDTLWHNMRFFDATEQTLFDFLRPLGVVKHPLGVVKQIGQNL